MIILGIETSCDETAAALLSVKGGRFNLLSSVVSSQIKIHQPYGGVVPEIAARNHLVNMLPVVDQAFQIAGLKIKQLDRLAVTVGPGLVTSLLVGAQTAKTLAFCLNKPLCPVNHLKAHLYANWLANQKMAYPAMCLIVSGGHTELILVKGPKDFAKVGQTLDDAAGEAFDKVAQLLEVGYPGGPIVSKLAQEGSDTAYAFPRPLLYQKNFNFSFSGLKTSVLYTKNKIKKITPQVKADLCASFQLAAVDVLTKKTIAAARHYRAKSVMLSGGVAANKLLRETLRVAAKENKLKFLLPDFEYCTDNAAMIAVAGYFEKPVTIDKIKVDPNLEITA